MSVGSVSGGARGEWRVRDVVGCLRTVFPGFVSGVNGYLVVAARIGVVVRIHGGYLGGYAFFIEGG